MPLSFLHDDQGTDGTGANAATLHRPGRTKKTEGFLGSKMGGKLGTAAASAGQIGGQLFPLLIWATLVSTMVVL